MRNTEYHINSIQADLNPDLGEEQFAATHVELQMEEGDYDEEEDSLTADATFELELYSIEDHEELDEDEGLGNPSYGTVEYELTVLVNDLTEVVDEEVDIEEEMNTWESGRYRETASDIIMAIESGFVQEIIAPTAQLLDQSFYGILPIFRFTETPEDDDDDESDSED